MHLEELIIEGFKSYVSRTHITGWDREFNAITGLNGSGKSNILDAICFVLGITNLSQVRASNLQDLIYKRGQAGVTKASVTIVFNNQDREKSPVGHEAYNQITVTRQVLMGGKTKYIVNGHNAQQQMVQNLFQSVQLNINNPHFLIMQGRITKVLNMKPVEILSMVEEAAGTKMFEDRKNKAFLTMGKKERKVEEINTILNEEITPKLDHLRAEKRLFLDFQKNESEMERLNRLLIAHEYSRHYERLNKSGADTNARMEKISELKASADVLQNEISNIDQEKQTISDRMKKESMGGTKMNKLEQELKEYATRLVRLNTKKTLLESSTLDEQKNLVSLRSQKGEMESNLIEKKESFNNVNKEYASFKITYDEKTQDMNRTSELIQTLTTGVSAEEGHENGYMEQLQKSKNIANKASTAVEQASLKMKHMRKELGEKEQQLKNAKNENQGAMVQLDKKKSEIGELEGQLSALDWNPDHETSLQKERKYVQDTLNDLYEKQEHISRKLTSLDFQYSNPSANFDRSQVRGLVAELITLDKERHEAATALEVCAGGRLYNVVVENEKVGAQLLDKGRLRRRWTFIPLNKIQGAKASDQKVKHAKKIGKGHVDLALDLIGYDDEVQQAMEYIFGTTFVCRDAQTAKEVTFHKDIRVKSVTYDGDIYDPQGTLSGGSKPNTSGVLVKLQELNEIRADIKHHTDKLNQLEKEIQSNQKQIGDYNKLKQRLDLKSHELHLLEQRISNSTHAQLATRIQSLHDQIKEQENAKEEAKKAEEKAKIECEHIESEMADFNANKDTKLEEMTKHVAQLKSQLAKSANKMKDMQRTVQTFELEIEQLDIDIESSQQEIDKSSESIKTLKAEMVEIENETTTNEAATEKTRNQLDRENEILIAHNEELTELSELHEKKSNSLVEINLQIQKITHENEKFAKEQQASQQIVTDFERTNEWIVDQREYFGLPNTPYDYTHLHIQDARKELKQLRANHDSMRKKINNRVMNMIDNVEKKETSLKKMLSTVQKDKEKIEQTIQSLETYKMEALEKTFRKVNKDFAEIFGDLLAGNSCKLQAPEGKTISEGLEVKVNLGGIWKQSLTELSGGQRSLIALSLILSLLQFKPAPMYILDEVDAALDISHTQNIGSLLRTRFKGSQFLVVSLKDGMFNNANVLFKTRFKDGTSVVERTTPYRTELASKKRSRDKENQRVAA